MAKANVFICDICQQEKRFQGWADVPSSVSCQIPGGRTQLKSDYKEVCDACCQALATAYSKALYSLIPNKKD